MVIPYPILSTKKPFCGFLVFILMRICLLNFKGTHGMVGSVRKCVKGKSILGKRKREKNQSDQSIQRRHVGGNEKGPGKAMEALEANSLGIYFNSFFWYLNRNGILH